MVKHIVMFQFTPQVQASNRLAIIEKLRASIEHMKWEIPELINAELWTNNLAGSHDVALFCEFLKPEEVAVFLQHELHQAHKEMAKAYVCNRVFLDYQE